MLPEYRGDQAEGLRRLLMRAATRVVTVAAARPGLGATSVVVNLAATLACAGKGVLVVDENLSRDSVGNLLALRPRYDLLDAVRRDKTLREIMPSTPQGVRVLPAACAIRALPQMSAPQREYLLECLAEASAGVDVVLVDAAASHGISASLATDQPLLLVLNPTAHAITESYAMLKRMAVQDGRRNFWIAVNKARNESEARTVFGNVAQVARRHLHARVEYIGYIPVDEKLKRATQLCRPVMEDFPAAASALAFGEMGHNLLLRPFAAEDEACGLSDAVQRLMQRVRSPKVTHAI